MIQKISIEPSPSGSFDCSYIYLLLFVNNQDLREISKVSQFIESEKKREEILPTWARHRKKAIYDLNSDKGRRL